MKFNLKSSISILSMFLFAIIASNIVSAVGTTGPSRPTFDYTDSVGQYGSLNGPVFNSFINTSVYGDERNFVNVTETGSTSYMDTITANDDGTYTLRAYYHNNANTASNDSGLGIALDSTVRFDIPTTSSTSHTIMGYVSASNATPQTVYDAAVINSTNSSTLEYVLGSATLVNNYYTNGITLSDSIVNNGALIGYDSLNGEIPGCFAYNGYVTITVQLVEDVIATPTPTVTPAPTAVPTATATPTVTPAPTAVPTATPTPTPTAVPTVTPTATPTVTPAPTAVPTVTPTATPTVTPAPTAVPTVTPTATPTVTPAPTAVPQTIVQLPSTGLGSNLSVMLAGIAFGIISLKRFQDAK